MMINIKKLIAEAETGSVVAKTVLGSRLLDGIGIEADPPAALELLTEAAEAGSPRAMVHLARMYAEGIAVPVDAARAQSLYEAASEKGEFLAHIYLARTHLLADPAKAADYYRRAADLQGILLDSDEMREAVDFLASELNPDG